MDEDMSALVELYDDMERIIEIQNGMIRKLTETLLQHKALDDADRAFMAEKENEVRKIEERWSP